VFEFLAKAIKQEREIKETQIEKEEVKLSLFADDTFLYLKDPKESTREFLALINTFSNIAGYKINIQISVAFLYTNNKHVEKEIKKIIPFTIASKKIPRNKLNPGEERLYNEDYKTLKKEI
jgi:hypothetical protein